MSVVLLMAGFIWKPGPDMKLDDYKASLAINMRWRLYDEARTDIQEILKRNPEDLYTHLMRAYLLFDEGEIDQAIKGYEQAMLHAGDQPEIIYSIIDTICRLALKEGRYGLAKQYAEKRTALFGENVASKLIIALSYFLSGDDKLFEENMDRAVEMGIFDPAFMMKLDALVDNRDKLNELYLQSLINRAKYERQLLGKLSM